MQVLFLILLFASSSLPRTLISSSEIEHLFKKYMRHELSDAENGTWQDLIEVLYRPRHLSSSLLGHNDERPAIDCIICRSAFAALFDGVHNGQTDEEISDVVTTLCTSIGIESYTVCSGAIALNVPIIRYIILNTPEASPQTFCGLVLQTSGNPNFCPYNDPRFEWQIELPEQSPIKMVVNNDSKPFKVILITDAHVDPLYEAFGVANCGEPTCCRKGQTPAETYSDVYKSNIDESFVKDSISNVDGEFILDLSVAEKIRSLKNSHSMFAVTQNAEPAGYWGDYRNCDTPLWAFDDVLDTIAESHKDIDAVYYIGDSIDHGVWETSYELINDMNIYVIDKIRKTFGDDVYVAPVIGNHESQPTNQFAPATMTDAKLNTTWLYKALAKKWSYYLNEDAKATFLNQGDYARVIRPGLKIISLNNNVAYKYNWWLVYDPLDAKKHLDWLVEELYKSELAGEKVHILTHIPPGTHDLTHTWTREYNKIINRFKSTIMAEFNGHTHSDEFKIFYDAEGKPINMAWGAGSATSYTFYNLNYKIAIFDTTTYEPINILNYVYNLTEANLTPNQRPHWFLLYDIKQRFNLNDLSAVSVDDLVHRMVTDNRELLDLYAAFYSKVSDIRWPNCDNNCKINNLCKTVVTVLWERQRCDELRILFNS